MLTIQASFDAFCNIPVLNAVATLFKSKVLSQVKFVLIIGIHKTILIRTYPETWSFDKDMSDVKKHIEILFILYPTKITPMMPSTDFDFTNKPWSTEIRNVIKVPTVLRNLDLINFEFNQNL